LGWQWLGYSGEVPGYRGRHGGGGGWRHGGVVRWLWHRLSRGHLAGPEGVEPSGGGSAHGEEDGRAEQEGLVARGGR
jgi:hypothetical protein